MEQKIMKYPLPLQDYMVVIKCFTYNHEKYIEDALKGFVMQKTNFPFCALVVDDFSSDNTAQIIRKYEKEYPNIIKGVYLPENYYSQGGIKREKTEIVSPWFDRCKYIAMCEGDDYWIDPLKLQKQVDFMEANSDYSVCFHNAIRLNERVEVAEKLQSFCFFKESRQITTEEIVSDWCIPTASLLYRRDALKNIQLPRFFSGDYTLELALASVGKVFYIDRYMSVYRLNEGGVSNKISPKRWAAQLCDLLDWYDEFTSHKYSEQILNSKKGANQIAKYCALRQKCILLPFLFMPYYTYLRIKNKLAKNS